MGGERRRPYVQYIQMLHQDPPTHAFPRWREATAIRTAGGWMVPSDADGRGTAEGSGGGVGGDRPTPPASSRPLASNSFSRSCQCRWVGRHGRHGREGARGGGHRGGRGSGDGGAVTPPGGRTAARPWQRPRQLAATGSGSRQQAAAASAAAAAAVAAAAEAGSGRRSGGGGGGNFGRPRRLPPPLLCVRAVAMHPGWGHEGAFRVSREGQGDRRPCARRRRGEWWVKVLYVQ